MLKWPVAPPTLTKPHRCATQSTPNAQKRPRRNTGVIGAVAFREENGARLGDLRKIDVARTSGAYLALKSLRYGIHIYDN
jgi:hypothetical protein